jgi:hypothetical protein
MTYVPGNPMQPDPIVFRAEWQDRHKVLNSIVSQPPQHPFIKGWFASHVQVSHGPEGYARVEVRYSQPSWTIEDPWAARPSPSLPDPLLR